MGEMAELVYEQHIFGPEIEDVECDFLDYSYEEAFIKGEWITANGEHISIDKMEFGHLQNTIAMLEKRRKLGKPNVLYRAYIIKMERRLKEITPTFGFLNAL